MFNRKYIREVEEDIESFKVCPILMLEHDNVSVAAKTITCCTKCDQRASFPLDNIPPIGASILICPKCKTKQKIAYLNLNKN